MLINPYNIDQTADAILFALTMDKEEQRARMERMRETIREHNVYLWAANLVSALARLRPAQEGVNERVDGSAPQ